MRRKRPPNIYQIWPEAKRRKARRSRTPWVAAAALFGVVFAGGIIVTRTSTLDGEPSPNVESSAPAPLQLVSDDLQPAQVSAAQIVAARPSMARFTFCHTGGGTNCVVDGDTIWYGGVKIRIADIDAPETHPPRCPNEADLGARATQRLAELLNAGPIELASIGGRDRDRYGRELRIVMRGGMSLGDELVAEGLARTWTGRREPWC